MKRIARWITHKILGTRPVVKIVLYQQWYDCRSMLPPLFESVVVWGVRENENICPQMYQARRWTGCTNGFDVEGDKLWEWLTPCDGTVKRVTHWMPLPHCVPTNWASWNARNKDSVAVTTIAGLPSKV